MATQPYTISHTGTVLEEAGEDAVTLSQNQVSPQRETEIAEFTCPSNFDAIQYVAERDPIRFKPRTKETFSGDGATTTFDLSARIQRVAGEDKLDDQPYPAVVAVADGAEADIESIDYAAGTVTLASAPADSTDNVHLFPIITEGTVKLVGENSLGQDEGPLYPWGHPIYRWHDMEQDRRGTEVNLQGSAIWERNETLVMMLDSPRQIVWEDDDYPEAYPSELEIDVQITF
jgi:hypothetical protein